MTVQTRVGRYVAVARVFRAVVLALYALLVFLYFLVGSDVNRDVRAPISKMVHGTANRPFVYRTLVPSLVRGLVAITPPSVKANVESSEGAVRALFPNVFIETGFVYETVLLFALLYLSLLGFALCVTRLYVIVTASDPRDERWLFLVPFLALYGLPPFFLRAFIYDLSTLFLMTLAMALMAEERWGLYLGALLLSCLNRETTVLLLLVFALYFYRRLPRPAFVKLTAAHLAILGATRIALVRAYRDNPGVQGEFHLLDFIQHYAAPYGVEVAVAWVAVLVLMLYRWSEKPLFLRRALWILVPLFAVYFTLGFPRETRIFYEAYPIVILLVIHSVLCLLREKATIPEGPRAPAA